MSPTLGPLGHAIIRDLHSRPILGYCPECLESEHQGLIPFHKFSCSRGGTALRHLRTLRHSNRILVYTLASQRAGEWARTSISLRQFGLATRYAREACHYAGLAERERNRDNA